MITRNTGIWLGMFLCLSSAQAGLVKCVDQNGNVTYTNDGSTKGCKPVSGEGVSVVPGYKPPPTHAAPAPLAPPTATAPEIVSPPAQITPVVAPTPVGPPPAVPAETAVPSAAPALPVVSPPVPSAEETAKQAKAAKRSMLERELSQAQEDLESAQQTLREQEGIRLGNEQNYAKAQERIQSYKYKVDLQTQKVEMLKKELESL